MRLVELRHETDLQRIRAEWDALLVSSGASSVFVSWEWITAWWSAYGKPGDLRILTAYDEDGILRGIAPLRAQLIRKFGQAFPTLQFIGDGSFDSDYLDFIIAPEWQAHVMEAFCAHWRQELEHGVLLLFNEVPGTSPNLALLDRIAGQAGFISKASDVPCGVVSLPAAWDDYLQMLRPRFRTKVRSVLRNLEGRPEVRFGFCQGAEKLRDMLPVLFDLHTRRWNHDGKPGVFGWDQKRQFYSALSPLLLDRDWLRFSWLEWNGRIIACQYGFEYNGVYSQLQEGYEPAAEHYNPGIALRAWSIRALLKQGVQEYDFLGGIGRHKTDWGACIKNSRRLLIARATFKNLAFVRGPQIVNHARSTLKALAPKGLSSIPDTSQESPGSHSPAGMNGWLRSTAASCYFTLRLPALVRPLRDRYQLSRGNNGSGRALRLTRRTAAAARILYYHRVNDDNDPFFPAISTSIFEREMRYVAQYYKVVSLSSMIDHLESGSLQPVVAITFDDGYQDNYWNALPILRRYGLPATIFLATDSIDSREPLWFEQLALATKTSGREYLDLELDIPRRFWLRTQAERLRTNRQLFELLRTLSDCDRRQWFAMILSQLAAPAPAERRGKMLTWDQVRLMNTQGIDFGGHTVTHPFISKLSQEQITWEVSECKRRIEAELQERVDHFAYPNGREQDFGKFNTSLIRNAGYRSAVTTMWGLNYPSTDRMELRRGGPWEETTALFAYKLDWYQLIND